MNLISKIIKEMEDDCKKYEKYNNERNKLFNQYDSLDLQHEEYNKINPIKNTSRQIIMNMLFYYKKHRVFKKASDVILNYKKLKLKNEYGEIYDKMLHIEKGTIDKVMCECWSRYRKILFEHQKAFNNVSKKYLDLINDKLDDEINYCINYRLCKNV